MSSNPAGIPGRVVISERALAQLARAAALEVYGVVGTGLRIQPPAVHGLRGRPSSAGVLVTRLEPDGLRLDVHVILGRGLNLAAVAESLRSRLTYELAQRAGERVDAVVVHIDGVADAGRRRHRPRGAAAATVRVSRRLARALVGRGGRPRTVRGSRRTKRAP